jgi:hypothetical protein
MIISINATVCAAVNHGEGARSMIVGSDRGQGKKWASEQEEQEIERRGKLPVCQAIAVSRRREVEGAPPAAATSANTLPPMLLGVTF